MGRGSSTSGPSSLGVRVWSLRETWTRDSRVSLSRFVEHGGPKGALVDRVTHGIGTWTEAHVSAKDTRRTVPHHLPITTKSDTIWTKEESPYSLNFNC